MFRVKRLVLAKKGLAQAQLAKNVVRPKIIFRALRIMKNEELLRIRGGYENC